MKTDEPQNKKRLHIEVTDLDALQREYPDAVKKVVSVKEDRTRLYALSAAHMTTGKPIPGVTITHPDGRVLAEEPVTCTVAGPLDEAGNAIVEGIVRFGDANAA